MLGLQRLGRIEEWIDGYGSNKGEKSRDRNHCDPKVQPPSPRASGHNQVEDPDHNSAHRNYECEFDGPVPQPRAPTLHRESIFEAEMVSIHGERQPQQKEAARKQRDDNDGLHEAATGNSLRPIAQFDYEPPTDK